MMFPEKTHVVLDLLINHTAFMSQDLSQRGVVVDRSFKHRSTNQSEHRRIKDLRGYFEDGCFNGVLAVTSAIENWELKSPFTGSSSPLISDPKIQQTILTEDDDFLISACDILSSWNAVSNITQRLRRGDPRQYVVVICFSSVPTNLINRRGWLRFCVSDEARALLQLTTRCLEGAETSLFGSIYKERS
ncbi:unnamed protein product [Brassica oleracea]